MGKIKNKLNEKKVLIADGAWGTLFQAAGLASGECPESWNMKFRDRVLEVARAYSGLGVDIIETNSFGGSSFKLESCGFIGKTYEINRAAVAISREACAPDQIVMASMGPTGKILMMGDVSDSQLYDAFREQAMAFRDGGADAVIIETMTDMEEARLAVKAVQDHTHLEIVCSFTFDQKPDGTFRTMMGLSPAQVAAELQDLGVSIVGTNCGIGLGNMVPIITEIHDVFPDLPILVNANAGMPEIKDGNVFYPDTPEVMANFIPEILDAGARIIGGCCGTTPAHIEAIQESVKHYFEQI